MTEVQIPVSADVQGGTASLLNSVAEKIRRGTRFMDSPCKLIKILQLARPENRASFSRTAGLSRRLHSPSPVAT